MLQMLLGFLHIQGCVSRLEMFVKTHLIVLGAVGLGLCCLQVTLCFTLVSPSSHQVENHLFLFSQIFGIVFACCLAKSVREYRELRDEGYWQ